MMKKTQYIALALLAALALTSCKSSSSGKKEFKVVAPQDIWGMCYEETMAAAACMRESRANLKLSGTITFVKQPGEKRFSGEWAWQYQPGQWVVGLYRPSERTCYIACNPTTFQDIRRPVLKHEAGHYINDVSLGQYGHPAEFERCFERWYEAMRSSVVREANGDIVIIDYATGEPDED